MMIARCAAAPNKENKAGESGPVSKTSQDTMFNCRNYGSIAIGHTWMQRCISSYTLGSAAGQTANLAQFDESVKVDYNFKIRN